MSADHLAPPLVEQLQRRLEEEQRAQRLPSVVAGLVRAGALAWQGAAGSVGDGPPGPETQYRMGSITKTFVAVTVLQLCDDGLVDLDDRVADHVADAPTGAATVAQTLAHGAGLQAETDGPWWERTPGGTWEQLLTLVRPTPPHPPGRRFHYSNVGYAVLAELVRRRRGADWFDVVRDRLLVPLGMESTTPRPRPPAAPGLAVHPYADAVMSEPEHDAGAMAAAGQLWSTVPDLARWAAFLAGDGAGLVDPDLLAAARRPVVVDDRPGQPWTAAHGLGLQVWNRDGVRSFGHGGSMPGFLAVLAVDAETGDGVVVATNTTAGLGSLATDLLTQFQAAHPEAEAPWRPADVTADALEVAGIWYWGPTPVAVHATGGDDLELRAVTLPVRSSRFLRRPDGSWCGQDAYYAGEQLRVVRDAEGHVSHLDLASFTLTRRPYDPAAEVPGGLDDQGWH